MPSPEIEKLRSIDRFGLEAVTGRRTFYLHEIQRLITAENIVNVYRSRKDAQNWAAWAAEHPRWAELLAGAEILANGELSTS